jgi:hypothetical protein
LTAFVPVPVGIDVTSLDDPMLVPRQTLQVVVPRPGVAADVAIPLVGGGDVEGALIKSGELGFEGVDLELIDGSGKTVGTARTDFDGFFLFERVPYGDLSAAGQRRFGKRGGNRHRPGSFAQGYHRAFDRPPGIDPGAPPAAHCRADVPKTGS